jgi:methyl-accepting chemotaxis protein
VVYARENPAGPEKEISREKLMKHSPFLRTVGIIFVITSILGVLISIVGIGTIWLVRPRIENSLTDAVNTINDTLHTTNKSLTVMGNVIELTKTNILTVETTIENLDETITGVSDSLDITAVLVGDDLRETIMETQTALTSASSSAKIIDNTLLFLASVPFIGVEYQPDVPLHTSLEQVAENLDDIPGSLESMEQTLSSTADGLDTFYVDLSLLAKDISSFEEDLSEAQVLLDEYHDIIEKTEEKLVNLRENISLYSILLSTFSTLLLFWMLIIHFSIFLQGWHYLTGEPKVIKLSDLKQIKRNKLNDTQNEHLDIKENQ